ncbi:MAG: CocE/NonD family hydrolase, partial [Myxococcales bacterium]|nr:CocE/NonD family hydrolase [Myxococcales bacterium]
RAQQSYLEQHYLKKEYRIAMRDGARLYTSVYLPKDQTRRYPILMLRTPYSAGPYGENAYRTNRFEAWRHLAEAGFILVFQDVRGRFMSEGEYVNVRPHLVEKRSEQDIDESSDTYDTIEWLIDNLPNHNGRVGMWGISYPGFYAAMGAIEAHPALKAVSPQAPVCEWFIGDDFHHNGTFNLALAFGFFTSFGVARPELTTEWPPRFDYGTPDGYDFFLKMGPLANA